MLNTQQQQTNTDYNTPSTVYVLYARRPDMPDHLEDIITETTDLDHLDKAQLWATANGFVAPRDKAL